MQKAEAEKKSAPRSDEESINFRPSPNFKHMKKYLKSKFEEMSGGENQNEEEKVDKVKVQNEPEEEKSQPASQEVKASTAAPQTTVVQPPLPPHPPPPDSPVPEIKQEIIEQDDLQYTGAENNEELYQQYTDTIPPEQDTAKTSGADVTMCRNFVRGTCMKGAACRFSHELIVSQLPGVYTFCRNFQNRQCTYAKCKFVHATVFEKEYFYRTGYLPPHAIAHLKALPPPPPPPPQPEEAALQEAEQPEYYPPTAIDPSVLEPIGVDCVTNPVPTYVMQPAQPTAVDPSLYTPGTSNAATANSGLKRTWNESFPGEESAYTEGELITDEPVAKKCKSCDSNEFRYQYHKNKVENMIAATDEVNKKMAHLNVKHQRLCTVLVTLFKQQTPTPAPGLSTLTSALEDKDKNLLEQMNLLLGSSNRTSTLTEEETIKNMLSSNVNQLLAKLLLSAAEQPSPQ